MLAIVLALLTAGCSGSGDGLIVTDARIGMPTGPNAALYLTVENHSATPDALEGADTTVANSIEIHETIAGDDGTMAMRSVDAPMEVSAGETLLFQPGGFHLMLVDVDRLDVGEEVEVTLTWKNAGEITFDAVVVEPQDVGEDQSHDG